MVTGRESRRRYSAEKRTRFVLHCLSVNRGVAECCREHQIAPSNFYRWRRTFINGGTAALQKSVRRAPGKPGSKTNVHNAVEPKSSLIGSYANCLRDNHPMGPRLPASAKLSIIGIVENAALSKTAALKLIGIPRSAYYRWLKRLHETGEVENGHGRLNHTKLNGTLTFVDAENPGKVRTAE